MKRRTLFVTLLIAAVLSLPIVLQPAEVAAIRYSVPDCQSYAGGTLIVGIACRDGLVLCGDKRLTLQDGKVGSDSAIKVGKIRDSAVFAYAGVAQYTRTTSVGNLVIDKFDLNDATHSYFLNYHTEPADAARELAYYYISQLSNPMSTIGTILPTTSLTSDGLLFEVWIFYLDDKRAVHGYIIDVTYSKPYLGPSPLSGLVEYHATKTPILDKVFSEPAPLAMGHPEVVREILTGSDSRFSDIRLIPAVRKVIQPGRAATTVSRDEAVEAACRFIAVSSVRSGLLVEGAGIGPTVDCLLLSPKRGVVPITPKPRWLTAPPALPPPPKPKPPPSARPRRPQTLRRH